MVPPSLLSGRCDCNGSSLFPVYQQKPKSFDKYFVVFRQSLVFDVEMGHSEFFVNTGSPLLLRGEVCCRSIAFLAPWFLFLPAASAPMSWITQPIILPLFCGRTKHMWPSSEGIRAASLCLELIILSFLGGVSAS